MENNANKLPTKLWRRVLLCVSLCGLISATAQAADAGKIMLIEGKVQVQGAPALLNSMIAEGASIKTGANGYLYLKTVDNGFLIVRPNSEVRIVQYTVDHLDPSKTKIKFELLNGVARSISGDAVKLARQNFRFNTPVAAIGVRGTDFTVYTNQETSRISVLSGGVVASGFDPHCVASGSGPCEGGSSLELFARQQGQVLQITRDQIKPQLIKAQGAAPDLVAPPRADEPKALAAAAVQTSTNVADIDLSQNKLKEALAAGNLIVNPPDHVTVPPVIPPVTPPVVVPPEPENTIVWGRYREVLGKAAEIDFAKQDKDALGGIVGNTYYSLYIRKYSDSPLPTSGVMGFTLKGSQAVIVDEQKMLTAASIENAKLIIDFAKSTFDTSLDLVSNKERFSLSGAGLIANGE
ncbi:MAG: FecR family protein, partial [Undibacterium sp.]|nr:FecR family protein [Undibacterium sp.]